MSEESEEVKEAEEKEEAPSRQGGKPLFDMRRFGYIFLGVILLMVLFNPDLRFQIGRALGSVLYPAIGFNGNYPILTLILAGTMMIAFSTAVRDIFMDWVEMAENQEVSNKFRSELMEAKRANKTTKVKKMEEMQPEISKKSMNMMKPQLKSMVVTMVVIISIFGWIWTFIQGLPNTIYSTPWALNANLQDSIIDACFFPFFQWIGVYMLISVPLGQVFLVLLKIYDFRKRLEDEESV